MKELKYVPTFESFISVNEGRDLGQVILGQGFDFVWGMSNTSGGKEEKGITSNNQGTQPNSRKFKSEYSRFLNDVQRNLENYKYHNFSRWITKMYEEFEFINKDLVEGRAEVQVHDDNDNYQKVETKRIQSILDRSTSRTLNRFAKYVKGGDATTFDSAEELYEAVESYFNYIIDINRTLESINDYNSEYFYDVGLAFGSS